MFVIIQMKTEDFMSLFRTTMQMGLGEAIQRLNLLHSKRGRGLATDDEHVEHDLILEALNQTKLDLGFDCDNDGVPDTIEIFHKTAKTSCCRIVDLGSDRRKGSSSRSSPKKTTSPKKTKKRTKTKRG